MSARQERNLPRSAVLLRDPRRKGGLELWSRDMVRK